MFDKNLRKSYYPTNERKNTIKRESYFFFTDMRNETTFIFIFSGSKKQICISKINYPSKCLFQGNWYHFFSNQCAFDNQFFVLSYVHKLYKKAPPPFIFSSNIHHCCKTTIKKVGNMADYSILLCQSSRSAYAKGDFPRILPLIIKEKHTSLTCTTFIYTASFNFLIQQCSASITSLSCDSFYYLILLFLPAFFSTFTWGLSENYPASYY